MGSPAYKMQKPDAESGPMNRETPPKSELPGCLGAVDG